MGPNGIRGAGAKNRHSDFFPANGPVAVPPPMPRSNSVPIATIQSMAHIKPSSASPPLEAEPVRMNGNADKFISEHATLKQAQSPSTNIPSSILAVDQEAVHKPIGTRTESMTEKMEHGAIGSPTEEIDDGQNDRPNGLDAFQREEALTVVHSPISGEQWQADLRKAGQELAQSAQGKKSNVKAEDEAQLVSPE